MTHYRFLATLCVLTSCSLIAQTTTINNGYSNGNQVSQSVSNGGNVTSSYYDPYGAGVQFPSTQFPSQQFPSASTPTPQNYNAAIPSNLPPVTYASTPTTVPLPTSTTTPSTATALPGLATTNIGPSILQQSYSQPGVPQTPSVRPPQLSATETPANLVIAQLPRQIVAPEEKYTPGLATISKDGRWAVNDMFFNLPATIAVRVEVIKPDDRYTPVSDKQLESQIRGIFDQNRILPELTPPLPCSPALPMFYVVIMAYPCDRTCVGMITAHLYESGKPTRIETPINGIWQLVSWERQSIVVSSCEDFEHEISDTVEKIAREFGTIYKYYHPIDEIPCFDTYDNPLIPTPTRRNKY